LERRKVLAESSAAFSSGRRRAEELPRDVRADDPDIWKRGTGNR